MAEEALTDRGGRPTNEHRRFQLFVNIGVGIADGSGPLRSVERFSEPGVVPVKNGVEVGNDMIG